MIGIYTIAIPTIAHEIGLTVDEVSAALEVLTRVDVAHYDHDEEMVFLPALAEHQVGETLPPKDRRICSIKAILDAVEGHRFAAMFLERYRQAYHLDVPLEPVAPASRGQGKKSGSRSAQDFFPRGPGLLAVDEPSTWTDTDGTVRDTPQTKGRLTPGKNQGHARLREFVRERAGHKCEVCGVHQSERWAAHVADHIISRANGGSHHPDNLQCLCDSCNCSKVGHVDAKGGLS